MSVHQPSTAAAEDAAMSDGPTTNTPTASSAVATAAPKPGGLVPVSISASTIVSGPYGSGGTGSGSGTPVVASADNRSGSGDDRKRQYADMNDFVPVIAVLRSTATLNPTAASAAATAATAATAAVAGANTVTTTVASTATDSAGSVAPASASAMNQALVLSTQRDCIIRVLSCTIAHLFPHVYESSLRGSVRAFDARFVPILSPVDYFHRLIEFSGASGEVLVMTLYHMCRLYPFEYLPVLAAATASEPATSKRYSFASFVALNPTAPPPASSSPDSSRTATATPALPPFAVPESDTAASGSGVAGARYVPPVMVGGFRLSPLNFHRTALTSLMVSTKFFDDKFYTNSSYARIGGIKTPEMSSLEWMLLKMLDFSVFISPVTYRQFFCYLAALPFHRHPTTNTSHSSTSHINISTINPQSSSNSSITSHHSFTAPAAATPASPTAAAAATATGTVAHQHHTHSTPPLAIALPFPAAAAISSPARARLMADWSSSPAAAGSGQLQSSGVTPMLSNVSLNAVSPHLPPPHQRSNSNPNANWYDASAAAAAAAAAAVASSRGVRSGPASASPVTSSAAAVAAMTSVPSSPNRTAAGTGTGIGRPSSPVTVLPLTPSRSTCLCAAYLPRYASLDATIHATAIPSHNCPPAIPIPLKLRAPVPAAITTLPSAASAASVASTNSQTSMTQPVAALVLTAPAPTATATTLTALVVPELQAHLQPPLSIPASKQPAPAAASAAPIAVPPTVVSDRARARRIEHQRRTAERAVHGSPRAGGGGGGGGGAGGRDSPTRSRSHYHRRSRSSSSVERSTSHYSEAAPAPPAAVDVASPHTGPRTGSGGSALFVAVVSSPGLTPLFRDQHNNRITINNPPFAQITATTSSGSASVTVDIKSGGGGGGGMASTRTVEWTERERIDRSHKHQHSATRTAAAAAAAAAASSFGGSSGGGLARLHAQLAQLNNFTLNFGGASDPLPVMITASTGPIRGLPPLPPDATTNSSRAKQ